MMDVFDWIGRITCIPAILMLWSVTYGKYVLLPIDLERPINWLDLDDRSFTDDHMEAAKRAVLVKCLLKGSALYRTSVFVKVFFYVTILSAFDIDIDGFCFYAGSGRMQ